MQKFRRIYIEIGNVCNLACSFCPPVERKNSQMKVNFFEEMLLGVRHHTEAVCLHLMGEPLNHPHFEEILATCEVHQVPVELTTNGTLLTEEKIQQVLSPIVRTVNISLQSKFSQKTAISDEFYFQRIFSFVSAAERLRPDLIVHLRMWNLGDKESLTESKRILAYVQTYFDIKTLNVPDVRRQKYLSLRGRIRLQFDSRFEWPHPNTPLRTEVGTCQGLSSHVGVLTDGTVVPCCLDKEGVLALGSLREHSLSEILSSQRAMAMKNGFAKGVLTESLCQRCDFVKRFDKKAQRLRQIGPSRPAELEHQNQRYL